MSAILSAGEAKMSRIELLPVEQGKTHIKWPCIHILFSCVGCTHANIHTCMDTHLGTATLLLYHMAGSVKYVSEKKKQVRDSCSWGTQGRLKRFRRTDMSE